MIITLKPYEWAKLHTKSQALDYGLSRWVVSDQEIWKYKNVEHIHFRWIDTDSPCILEIIKVK